MTDKQIAKVDLLTTDDGVQVRKWYEGWTVAQTAPDEVETLPGVWIVNVLMGYEKQGFACSMPDRTHGVALRGQVTRIDFFQQVDGDWRMRKYPEGWKIGQNPMETEVVERKVAVDEIKRCEADGWTVRRWPGGARAFKGAAKPVRDGATIKAMRSDAYDRAVCKGQTETAQNILSCDFAFDY